MENNKFFLWVSAISEIIGIGDLLYKTYKASQVVFSPISIIGVCCGILFLCIYFIYKNHELYYEIKKRICYLLRTNDSYFVENKESIYIFKSRTEMSHKKNHDIISNVSNLNHFSDKFKWSKEKKIEEINIRSQNANDEISLRRVENWCKYTVEFDGIGKGQKRSINIIIDDLEDLEKESLLFLSANVTYKTKQLKLVVLFRDANLRPKKIEYSIYDNYASEYPFIQKSDIPYNEDEQKIEIVEQMPIYGYRYVVRWEFEND